LIALIAAFLPWLFYDDAFIWASVFYAGIFLVVPLLISVTVGFIAFWVAMAWLPDRAWRSAQTFTIVLPFAVIVLVATMSWWRFYSVTHPPEIGPQQKGLPTLQLAKTLTPRDRRFGPSRLSWSADGERLVTYTGAEILTISPDGRYRKEFPLHTSGFLNVLHYLSGHRLLITPPDVEVGVETRDNVKNIAFSVIDVEEGKVFHDVSGSRAIDLAVSPDERFVAVICCLAPQVDIYSTVDWNRIATLDLRIGERGDGLMPQGLEFSPMARCSRSFTA
jgi:hypothetical protein